MPSYYVNQYWPISTEIPALRWFIFHLTETYAFGQHVRCKVLLEINWLYIANCYAYIVIHTNQCEYAKAYVQMVRRIDVFNFTGTNTVLLFVVSISLNFKTINTYGITKRRTTFSSSSTYAINYVHIVIDVVNIRLNWNRTQHIVTESFSNSQSFLDCKSLVTMNISIMSELCHMLCAKFDIQCIFGSRPD